MICQADFLITNTFKGRNIKVERMATLTNVDLEKTLGVNEEVVVNVQSTDVELVIYAPQGTDLKECTLKVKAAVDLQVIAYRSRSCWAIKIVPNTLSPEMPTTVNITCGDTDED